MRKRHLGALGACLGLMLLTVPAGAEDAKRAEALFEQAQKLRTAGRYSEACPKLEESQRLDPAVGTLLYLADCYEQTGRVGKAWRTFDQAEREATESGQQERAKAARDAKDAIDPKVGRIRIVATGERSAVTVWVDGDRLGLDEWAEPVRAEPGEHTIEAGTEAPTWSRKVDVADARTTKRVTLPDFADGSTTSSEPGEPDTGPATGLGAQEIAAVSVAALGVVALGVGIGLGVNSKSVYDESEPYCTEDVCEAEGISIRDDAYAQATGADVCFVVSGVALAAGLVLWLTAPSGEDASVQTEEPTEVTARLGPTGAALSVRW